MTQVAQVLHADPAAHPAPHAQPVPPVHPVRVVVYIPVFVRLKRYNIHPDPPAPPQPHPLSSHPPHSAADPLPQFQPLASNVPVNVTIYAAIQIIQPDEPDHPPHPHDARDEVLPHPPHPPHPLDANHLYFVAVYGVGYTTFAHPIPNAGNANTDNTAHKSYTIL